MGKHVRGKHRLVTSRNVRARVGAASVIVALGLTGGALASPIASAAPATQQVALQAFSTPLPTDDHHNGDRDRGGRDDHRGDRGRRGHWENVCGSHRDWDGAHHRWFQHNRCERTWRNW